MEVLPWANFEQDVKEAALLILDLVNQAVVLCILFVTKVYSNLAEELFVSVREDERLVGRYIFEAVILGTAGHQEIIVQIYEFR